jgi:hypothetical protein
MPGCGKSRLVDFLIHRPGVLEHYGLSSNLKAIWIDGDLVAEELRAVYVELLRAFAANRPLVMANDPYELRNRVVSEIQQLDPEVTLVVFFDNFSRSLQHALGEDFFNFLYGLRNRRPRLNISYIFMANLDIDRDGFQKTRRLFAKGVDQSICWLSLLNEKDTFFSINRQLRRVEKELDSLSEQAKQRIYELTGGHALLTQQLSHLMLSGAVTIGTKPERVLAVKEVHAACQAIWQDLQPDHRNFLVEMIKEDRAKAGTDNLIQETLTNYGILKGAALFSPLFKDFVKERNYSACAVRPELKLRAKSSSTLKRTYFD